MGATMGLRLRARPELEMRHGVVHLLHLLPLTQSDVHARVEAALADNPMLERVSRSPGAGAASVVREPVVRPFDTLEVDAGCEVRSDCRRVLPLVVAHLTERGLLDCPPEDIARQHGIPMAQVAEAVRAIKAAGPAGIAETSVPAMLLAQAQHLVRQGEAPELLVTVIRDHLAAVADGDAATPAAALGVPVSAIHEVFRLVRTRLRPSVFTSDGTPSVRQVPDVFVSRATTGELEVEMAEFGIRLAAVPSVILADHAARAWLAEHQRAASLLVQQLDARSAVLRRVASAAVHHQAGFFERGRQGHVPLARTDLAAELGLHPSTVSRAVAGKAMRCPDGTIIPLADLFGGAVAIKARIAELARHERMTDVQLAAALAADGHRVARRTVAKYRAELGIPAGRS